MKPRYAYGALIGLIGVLAVVSCRRSDFRTAVIHVPRMVDARSIRIVTNAALNEIFGKYDGIQNAYEVDLARQVILYHESGRLLNPDYRRRIEARASEVGYSAKVLDARPNPPAPVPTPRGALHLWTDRVTAVISVPGMRTATDANIVIDAIAYARLGRDDPRITVHPASRRIQATYDGFQLAPKNIETAIACVGFDANAIPARLGAPDAPPFGWTPIRL